MPLKPAELFARDREWSALSAFAEDSSLGATLGLVYGRRRQGKTLMLELLAEATGGFMFTAREQSSAQNLADLSLEYARFTGQPESLAFSTWSDMLDALLRLGADRDRPIPVILDEFPHLVGNEPALASLLQIALSPRSFASRQTRTRVILCGSALTVMRGLLSGSAPLRGRASLELVLPPFWFRDAAAFWGVSDDAELAFRVNALVGGTPAYLRMSGGAPPKVADFDNWAADRLLGAGSAMFREGNLLLHEEPQIADLTPYHSVLTAISDGAERRTEIAGRMGRSATAISHLLEGLEQIAMIERVPDAFRAQRSVYRLRDPLIRLHQLIITRNQPALARGLERQVWNDNADTVAGKIYGPHLEDLAREWCLMHAETNTLGGRAQQAVPAVLPCREHRQGHEVDVVALEDLPFQPRRVLAIGEAKATGTAVGEGALERLDHLRALIQADRAPEPPKLLLFARAGFTPNLRSASAQRPDVELIDLNRLYNGG